MWNRGKQACVVCQTCLANQGMRSPVLRQVVAQMKPAPYIRLSCMHQTCHDAVMHHVDCMLQRNQVSCRQSLLTPANCQNALGSWELGFRYFTDVTLRCSQCSPITMNHRAAAGSVCDSLLDAPTHVLAGLARGKRVCVFETSDDSCMTDHRTVARACIHMLESIIRPQKSTCPNVCEQASEATWGTAASLTKSLDFMHLYCIFCSSFFTLLAHLSPVSKAARLRPPKASAKLSSSLGATTPFSQKFAGMVWTGFAGGLIQ